MYCLTSGEIRRVLNSLTASLPLNYTSTDSPLPQHGTRHMAPAYPFPFHDNPQNLSNKASTPFQKNPRYPQLLDTTKSASHSFGLFTVLLNPTPLCPCMAGGVPSPMRTGDEQTADNLICPASSVVYLSIQVTLRKQSLLHQWCKREVIKQQLYCLLNAKPQVCLSFIQTISSAEFLALLAKKEYMESSKGF